MVELIAPSPTGFSRGSPESQQGSLVSHPCPTKVQPLHNSVAKDAEALKRADVAWIGEGLTEQGRGAWALRERESAMEHERWLSRGRGRFRGMDRRESNIWSRMRGSNIAFPLAVVTKPHGRPLILTPVGPAPILTKSSTVGRSAGSSHQAAVNPLLGLPLQVDPLLGLPLQVDPLLGLPLEVDPFPPVGRTPLLWGLTNTGDRPLLSTVTLCSDVQICSLASHLWLLERFHQRCLRSILNIHWSAFIPNVEVLEMAEADGIESTLLKIQLRWVGHVSRMEDHRLPKIMLYGELSTGHRDRGAPKKRYKDCLKKSLGACHIDHRQWADIASNRASWRLTVRRAETSFEEDRRAHLTDKRGKTQRPTPTNQFSPATAATASASPASDLSATNEPAADVDIYPLHKSSSTKPSQKRSAALLYYHTIPLQSLSLPTVITCRLTAWIAHSFSTASQQISPSRLSVPCFAGIWGAP
ncbi:uncharacterized protein [Narcine bancroftii]|uniref:uncharacterized protein n=1 Tax=Narcine bancroftii TaxID=1343680 RepID=UPI003831CC4B